MCQATRRPAGVKSTVTPHDDECADKPSAVTAVTDVVSTPLIGANDKTSSVLWVIDNVADSNQRVHTRETTIDAYAHGSNYWERYPK